MDDGKRQEAAAMVELPDGGRWVGMSGAQQPTVIEADWSPVEDSVRQHHD